MILQIKHTLAIVTKGKVGRRYIYEVVSAGGLAGLPSILECVLCACFRVYSTVQCVDRYIV